MEEMITYMSAGLIKKSTNSHSNNVKLFFLVMLIIENKYSVRDTKEKHRDSHRIITDGEILESWVHRNQIMKSFEISPYVIIPKYCVERKK